MYPRCIHKTYTGALSELVNRSSFGHVYVVSGEVPEGKLLKLLEKFNGIYFCDRTASKRNYHKVQHRQPSVHFVALLDQEEYSNRVQWWLMATGPELFDMQGETYRCLHDGGEQLIVDGRYVLKKTARPKYKNAKTGQMEGGGKSSVIVYLTRDYYREHLVNIRSLASAHGRPFERTDDLRREVLALRTFPMFRGVRDQVRRLLNEGIKRWQQTHRTDFPVKEAFVRLPTCTPVGRSRKKDQLS